MTALFTRVFYSGHAGLPAVWISHATANEMLYLLHITWNKAWSAEFPYIAFVFRIFMSLLEKHCSSRLFDSEYITITCYCHSQYTNIKQVHYMKIYLIIRKYITFCIRHFLLKYLHFQNSICKYGPILCDMRVINDLYITNKINDCMYSYSWLFAFIKGKRHTNNNTKSKTRNVHIM
jgi:hypothetical protein